MPVQPTYPGVYVQEVPSGVRTIVGVSTSVALFIGRATRGPIDQPIQCLSYTDFVRVFSDDTSLSEMPHYVKLFFINGGTNCFVMRIAEGATQSNVEIENQVSGGGVNVLQLTAKQHGVLGETIRANITYSGQQPDRTFNIELFRIETNAAGVMVNLENENFLNLSMDSNHPNFAPEFLNQNSKLVDASAPAPILNTAFSQSGRPIDHDGSDAELINALDGITGANTLTSSQFRISVDGNQYVTVDLSGIDIAGLGSSLLLTTAIDDAIVQAHDAANILGIAVTVSFEAGPIPTDLAPITSSSILQIASDNATENASVIIIPGTVNDAAVPLMLGTAQGGYEVGATSGMRPAPNGLATLSTDYVNNASFLDFASLDQNLITQIDITYPDVNGVPTTANIPISLVTTNNTHPNYVSDATPANGNRNGVREKLAIIRDVINKWQIDNKNTFFLRASLNGSHLSLYSTNGNSNTSATIAIPVPVGPNNFDLADIFTSNVRNYSVGASGTGNFQTPAGGPASDGSAPILTTYDDAYEIVESQVDIFNLLILPPDRAPVIAHSDLWGAASAFCQRERAFLLMDTPSSWTTSQLASNGVDALRLGLVNDHSAVFYPRLQINDNGRNKLVGASGAIAGLMARIDTSRGVWKAPAGTEATIRGVNGLEYKFSDRQNGVMNPRAVNNLRIFPNGIVNWGARTMDGDDDFASEWKYIPVRRTALFIEESLFRGLKWVVFEPNDEPLWAQIRLNVGAFMHNLFRQGAFQGATKKDAYFVKCDSETTTQNDINLGIVNIWVGFAPLKPAEFVILSLQQMTGQIEV